MTRLIHDLTLTEEHADINIPQILIQRVLLLNQQEPVPILTRFCTSSVDHRKDLGY